MRRLRSASAFRWRPGWCSRWQSAAAWPAWRQGLSPGYGFTGFLISWLAGGRPAGILLMAFLFALITAAGDTLQITQGLPYAVVNILLAMILFIVLGRRPGRGASR
jgi:general nucleoside transport system permease protein